MTSDGLGASREEGPDLAPDWRAVGSVDGMLDGMFDLAEVRVEQRWKLFN